jgi:hypothetical protein
MTDVWIRAIGIVVCSVLGSGGLWAYLQSKDTRRSATTRLLMGVAYAQITTLGVSYLDRGWITKDEYEELNKYFYEPYKALGGNGVAERVMNGVSRLPLRSHSEYAEIFRNRQTEGYVNNVQLVTHPGQVSPPE